jgi:hypothetical protein
LCTVSLYVVPHYLVMNRECIREQDFFGTRFITIRVPACRGPLRTVVCTARAELTTYSDCCGSINRFMIAVVAVVAVAGTAAIVFWFVSTCHFRRCWWAVGRRADGLVQYQWWVVAVAPLVFPSFRGSTSFRPFRQTSALLVVQKMVVGIDWDLLDPESHSSVRESTGSAHDSAIK